MSWDDFDDECQWERHKSNLAFMEIAKGREAMWLSVKCSIKVSDITDSHIRNCLKFDTIMDEWRELFENELKYRRVKMADDQRTEEQERQYQEWVANNKEEMRR